MQHLYHRIQDYLVFDLQNHPGNHKEKFLNVVKHQTKWQERTPPSVMSTPQDNIPVKQSPSQKFCLAQAEYTPCGVSGRMGYANILYKKEPS